MTSNHEIEKNEEITEGETKEKTNPGDYTISLLKKKHTKESKDIIIKNWYC